jgi:acetyl esterase
MPRNDPQIGRAAARRARQFQAVFPLMKRLLYSSGKVQFATKKIAKPTTIQIPTRHGSIRTLVYAPPRADLGAGQLPPVHLITHGGAFIIRVPQQEDNVARYLASEIGCYVVIPDYDTAPTVRFPVQEQECYDIYRWIHEHGRELRWDADRITVGGASSGAKLALNVALMAIDDGYYRPLAISSEFGVADMSRPDEARTSPKKNPVVPPSLMKLVRDTYFAATALDTPLASPALHPRLAELPPTLIETAALDTLKGESNALAEDLRRKGVTVTHREFAGVDHGFTHTKPVDVAREAIRLLGEHLAIAYAGTPVTKEN